MACEIDLIAKARRKSAISETIYEEYHEHSNMLYGGNRCFLLQAVSRRR